MVRLARVIAVGFPYHVTESGNAGQFILASDSSESWKNLWDANWWRKRADASQLQRAIRIKCRLFLINNEQDLCQHIFVG